MSSGFGSRQRPAGRRELPDYYVAPTRDFTQYTKDYEEKYWSKETAFDWQQSVAENLKAHVASLPPAEFHALVTLVLPMVDRALHLHIEQIRRAGLPPDDDALKDIGESLSSDKPTVAEALALLEPLGRAQFPVAQLKDRLAILRQEASELREQQRLGVFKRGTLLRRLETEAERRTQTTQLATLADQIDETRRALTKATAQCDSDRAELQVEIGKRLAAIEPRVLAELESTRDEVRRAMASGTRSGNGAAAASLRDLVWKRQHRALKDIANHALVVEQSAIAPLSMGVIHYKRRREIQEAMTTFVNDEAKHAAVFRRFMAQKLDAKERVPHAIIKGGDRYLWLARFLPSGAVFLAVIVEAIGGAFLEFFGDERHMPEPLFRSICRTIAERDERRHIELCAETYNELYRTGSPWERLRNNVAWKAVLKSAYGDKTEDHQLLQACRAFGLQSQRLYQFVAGRLSEHLTRIGLYVPPERFLEFMRTVAPPRGPDGAPRPPS
jgi:hypothetical protein